jgi:CP family cyanate transporter-like MFS transporter
LALGIFFGTQSMQAYVQFGWIAQIYRDGGLAPELAGLMTSIIAALGFPAGLVMPLVVGRVRDLRPVIWAFGLLLAAGYLGVWLLPTTLPWLWAVLLGLSGFAFPTALALVTARTRHPRVTTQLSGFAQSVGYALAAIGPFLVGVLFEVAHSWTLPLLLLIGSAAAMIASGLVAAGPGYVDDDDLPATVPQR